MVANFTYLLIYKCIFVCIALLWVFFCQCRCIVTTYWPSTEASIKRCTCVNKQKNSETGASGRRYRNITLTCGRGWIRWWWQMHTPAGSRWMSDNYIARCDRRLGSVGVPVAVGVSWGQDASVRISLQSSETHGWAAQPGRERSAAMVRRTLGQYVAVCPRLQLTSHTQETSTLSRIKSERFIFYKEVCLFVHWSSSLLLTMLQYIFLHVLCICIRIVMYVAIQHRKHFNTTTILWEQHICRHQHNTNNFYIILWFQIFLSNNKNLCMICFQVFLYNAREDVFFSDQDFLLMTLIWTWILKNFTRQRRLKTFIKYKWKTLRKNFWLNVMFSFLISKLWKKHRRWDLNCYIYIYIYIYEHQDSNRIVFSFSNTLLIYSKFLDNSYFFHLYITVYYSLCIGLIKTLLAVQLGYFLPHTHTYVCGKK